MSAKNDLQELLMRQRKPLPVYHSIKSGPGHKPVFVATCTVENETFTGSQGMTRKQAEQHAALLALDHLGGKKTEQESKTESIVAPKQKEQDANCLVLIDGDNLDVGLPLVVGFPFAQFMFYISKNGSKEGLLKEYMSLANCSVQKAPMIGKDACDIFMTYEARHLRNNCPNIPMAIVTKDHFGSSLAFLTCATHLCSEAELETWLKKNYNTNAI